MRNGGAHDTELPDHQRLRAGGLVGIRQMSWGTEAGTMNRGCFSRERCDGGERKMVAGPRERVTQGCFPAEGEKYRGLKRSETIGGIQPWKTPGWHGIQGLDSPHELELLCRGRSEPQGARGREAEANGSCGERTLVWRLEAAGTSWQSEHSSSLIPWFCLRSQQVPRDLRNDAGQKHSLPPF